MRSFLAALRFLTGFPWLTSFTITPGEIGKSALFFPLVGFCLGLILVFFNWFLDPYLASEIISVLLVALLILMTRGTHLDGLKNSFDELGLERERGQVSMAMREGRVGILGVLAVLVMVALKFRAIEVMGDARSEGLLLAPVLGRWAMVVLAYGSESRDQRAGQLMAEYVRGAHLLLATATALLLVTVFAGRMGLWIALWVSLLTLLSRSYLHRRFGGLAVDHLGAVEEIGETLSLVLFASL